MSKRDPASFIRSPKSSGRVGGTCVKIVVPRKMLQYKQDLYDTSEPKGGVNKNKTDQASQASHSGEPTGNLKQTCRSQSFCRRRCRQKR